MSKSSYAEQLYLQARALEGDLLRESHARLDMLAKRHRLDVAEYRFRCERYGDFLAIFVERNGKKLCTALNLAQTKEFQLIEGHEPDMKGTVTYTVCRSNGGGGYSYSSNDSVNYNSDDLEAPPVGCLYKVFATLPHIRCTNDDGTPNFPMIISGEGARDHRGAGVHLHYNPYRRVETNDVSRDALDDCIIFRGIETTLFVPATLGAGVRDEILRWLGRVIGSKQ